MIIQPKKRNFLPENLNIDWDALAPLFEQLLARELNSSTELEQWLKDRSELEAALEEDFAWRYIKMTCDTTNEDLVKSFQYFATEIEPKMASLNNDLNQKFVSCAFADELDAEKYFIYTRGIKKALELFREENIPLQSELAVMQQHFGVISGKMTVTINDKEYTLQQAAKFLENPDRAVREDAYRKIQERRLQDKDALNELFNNLMAKRNEVAKNAGFTNYTDYRFKELGRFDYDKEACYAFHRAVKEQVVPLVKIIYQRKKEKLGLDTLRPWDLEAEQDGVKALQPFATSDELLEKSITCFSKLRPFFGDCLAKMKSIKHLDLESRRSDARRHHNGTRRWPCCSFLPGASFAPCRF